MIAWTLFYNPIVPHSDSLLWLLGPLCVSAAIIYKTVRTHNLRRLHLEILALLGYMVAGLTALGVGLWLIQKY